MYCDEYENSVLMMMAIDHDWPKAAAALIERGCDVNAQGDRGMTPLHCAGFENHRETARVLLERGADRTIKNKKGETAADLARTYGSADLAAYIEGAAAQAHDLPALHALR